jgi:hypothetical protein
VIVECLLQGKTAILSGTTKWKHHDDTEVHVCSLLLALSEFFISRFIVAEDVKLFMIAFGTSSVVFEVVTRPSIVRYRVRILFG